jgi:hypothetical protein
MVMLELFIIYLPSLILLAWVNYEIIKILSIAIEKKSIATSFITGIMLALMGVLISWGIVLAIAYNSMLSGSKLISWEIALLPIGWALILIVINKLIKS